MMLKYIRKRKERDMNKDFTRSLTRISLFAALMAVSALIYIPLPVPITLQTLVMFSALFILGGRDGSIAVFVYILLGALGLPVFSGFSGGVARLLDASGGYILGMLAGALLYWLLDVVFPKRAALKVVNSAICLLTIYVFGTLWFTFVYANGEKTLGAVLLACVVPFIIPDAIKIYLAYYISKKIPRLN